MRRKLLIFVSSFQTSTATSSTSGGKGVFDSDLGANDGSVVRRRAFLLTSASALAGVILRSLRRPRLVQAKVARGASGEVTIVEFSGSNDARCQPGYAQNSCLMHPMRRACRTCIRRWPRTYRSAILHKFSGPQIRQATDDSRIQHERLRHGPTVQFLRIARNVDAPPRITKIPRSRYQMSSFDSSVSVSVLVFRIR